MRRCVRNEHFISGTYFTMSCLCGGLAMLSKEQGLTSLFICLLMDVSHQYKWSYERRQFTTASFYQRQIILIAWVMNTMSYHRPQK